MMLPRVRLTVRRMMVLVAVVSLAMGIESSRRAWAYRRERVRWFAMSERLEREKATKVANAIARGREDLDGVAEMALWQAEDYARRRRKWEAAAARPWAAEPPDPPALPKPNSR